MLRRRKLIRLAVIMRNRFQVPKLHKNAPKAEISSEDRLYVNTRRCLGAAKKNELNDAELSRAEALEALESAGELDAKEVTASTLRAQASLPKSMYSRGQASPWKRVWMDAVSIKTTAAS